MKSFVMFLAIATAGARASCFSPQPKRSKTQTGLYKACREANWFCHNPQVLAFIAVGLIVLWALATLLSAIRD
jgi:hypothetical protein